MIKNTHKAISDYSEGYKQIKNTYDQAMKYINDNYNPESALYKTGAESAKEVYRAAILSLKKDFKEIVKKDFENVREAIRQAVASPPHERFAPVLELVKRDKLEDFEFEAITSGINNYMTVKLLYDAQGKSAEFMSAEKVISRLDDLESRINKFFGSYSEEGLDKISYNNALILNGSLIQGVDEETDSFLNTYTTAKGGE